MVICPESKQLENCQVMELLSRSEPAEFGGVLCEWEVPPAKGKDAGGELHRFGGSLVLVESSVTRGTQGEPGTQERGTMSYFWNTLFATQNRDRGIQEHTLMTLRLDKDTGNTEDL